MNKAIGPACFVILLELLCLSGFVNAAAIQKPGRGECDRHETFFKHNRVYTYDYTITTSSAFVGVSDSKAGSQIKCTVTLEVPRKCEIILQLSGCSLAERDQGADGTYTDVDDDFTQDLERYPLYFQTNNGMVLENAILADDRDTLQVLNIKRGVLSALQFQILKADEYGNPVQETDIFGTCSTQYTILSDGSNIVSTYRNLRECDLRQIFKRQFSSLFHMIKQVETDFVEKPISEGYYPFVSDVTCNYTLGDSNSLRGIACLQNQYFQPLAFKGDELATAISQISQNLEFVSVESEDLPNPNLSDDGQSLIGIKFDFGSREDVELGLPDVRSAMENLLDLYADSKYTYEEVPGQYETLVENFRLATEDTLETLSSELFDCAEPCTDSRKKAGMQFYLDALESCGTESCLLAFFHSLKLGRVNQLQIMLFMNGLTLITVSENVVAELYTYCYQKTYEETGNTFESNCMLHLGTALSHLEYPEDIQIPATSTLAKVMGDMYTQLSSNCGADTLTVSERQLNIALKVLSNIGFPLRMRYVMEKPEYWPNSDSPLEPIPVNIQNCLQNDVIPISVKRNIIQMVEIKKEETEYGDNLAGIDDALFAVLEDRSKDLTLRAMTFATLAKTTNAKFITRLIQKINDKDDIEQIQAYMKSFVRTLLDKNHPELQQVVESWKTVLKEEDVDLSSYIKLKPYDAGTSKSVNFNHFMKSGFTELFGGELYADVVFEPGNNGYIFSMAKYGLSYHYGNKKYNLCEVTFHSTGFNMLYEILSKHANFGLKDVMAMFAGASGHGQEDNSRSAKFAKFQQNIINAVQEILNSANHPGLKNFDFAVDVRVQGKHHAFTTLKDFMAVMSRKQPVIMGIMKKLMTGVEVTKFRAVEFGGIGKIFPTCAGLSLNHTVSVTGFNQVENKLQSNAGLYKAGRVPNLSLVHSQHTIFAFEFKGKMVIPIGYKASSAGLTMKATAGSERGYHMEVKYGFDNPIVQVENPTRRRLWIDLQPIEQNRESEELLYARGKMYLLHRSGPEQLENDPAVAATVVRCLGGKTSMFLGREFCANFVYANVTASRKHAYFPLSGPFDFSVRMSRLDSVTWYNMVWEYELQQVPGGLRDSFHFSHVGKGDVMNRMYYFNMTYDRNDVILLIESGIPELEISYSCNYNITPASPGFLLSEFIHVHGQPQLGYIFKRTWEKHFKEMLFNLTRPQASFQFHANAIETESNGHIDTYNSDVSLVYKRDQTESFFYMLHPFPVTAHANGDVSSFSISQERKLTWHGDILTKEVGTATLKVYGATMQSTFELNHTPISTNIHLTLSYPDPRQSYLFTKSITVTGNLQKSYSATGANYEITANCEGDSFVLNMHSIVDMIIWQQAKISIDADYTNNEATRKKRSLKSIYDKLSEVEHNIVETFEGFEDALVGAMDGDGIEGKGHTAVTNSGQMSQPAKLPQLPPLPDHSHFELVSTARPIFAPGTIPGKSPPIAIEINTQVTSKHPWNGGYRENVHSMTSGRNIVNNFKNYHFWHNLNSSFSYTSLDGFPVLGPDGDPLVENYHLDFHVNRISRKIFDYGCKCQTPDIDIKYSILFDWDAITHHEPLVHVTSSVSTDMMPLFNHHYDETFYYEPGHIKHSMNLHHAMLNATFDTDWFNGYTDFYQTVSFALQVRDTRRSFTMVNEFLPIPGAPAEAPKQLVCKILNGAMPDKTLIISFMLAGRKVLNIAGAVQMSPGSSAVPLWNDRLTLRGSSLLEVTVSWTPAYDQKAREALMQGPVRIYQLLSALADHLYENLDKPFMDKTIPGTKMTPKSLFIKIFGRGMIRAEFAFYKAARNFIPQVYVPVTKINGQSVPPRLAFLFQMVHQKKENSPMTSVEAGGRMYQNKLLKTLQTLNYYVVRGLSYFFLGPAKFPQTPLFQAMLQKREFTVANDLHMTFDRGASPFKEGAKFINRRVMLKTVGLFMKANSKNLIDFSKTSNAVGAVFGRDGTNRKLVVKTFDGVLRTIDATQTEECSYLLAADLTMGHFSIIISPAGVTLITPVMTVSIGWDKQVFIDNCKVNRVDQLIDSADGTVNVENQGNDVIVKTKFGVYLHCDLENADICVISLDGYKNRMTGLLGTNNKDVFTDRLLVNGAVAASDQEILSQFVVAGPDSCKDHSVLPAQPTDQLGNSKDDEKCDPIDCFRQQLILFGTASKSLIMVCQKIAHVPDPLHIMAEFCPSCDADLEDICYTLEAMADICTEQGFLPQEYTQKEACKLSPTEEVKSSLDGSRSLDIVFVVSQHATMVEKGYHPWQYMYELIGTGHPAWRQFDSVRVGLEGFGLDDSQSIVWNEFGENRYFEDIDMYDWSKVKKLEANGHGVADGFLAIQEAAKYPFNPTAHKMIVLIMTKEQGKGVAPAVVQAAELKEKGIVLNVVSTYAKTSSRRIIGINWDGKVISKSDGYQEEKSLPNNDYAMLIKETKGALWDLVTIGQGRFSKVSRVVEEFLHQTQQLDSESCPAA